MPNYVKRAAEIFALAREFASASAAEAKDASEHQTDTTLAPAELAAEGGAERKSFVDRPSEYFALRQQVLDGLVADMRSTTSGDTDGTEVWRRNVAQLKPDLIATLGLLLSGISNPSERATALKWKITSEEEQFNDSLLELGDEVAETGQTLALLVRDMRTAIANNQKEWTLLLDKAEEIQRTAAAAVARMLAGLQDGPGAGDPHIPNLRTHCVAITQAASVAGRTLGELRASAEAAFDQYARTLDEVQRIVDGWRAAVTRAESDIATLKSLQAAEIDSLHRVFREKRQAVADFVKEPPTQKADALRTKIHDAWTVFEPIFPPSIGAEADAILLSEALAPPLDELETQVADLYRDFVNEFHGRFLDSVNDDTVKQLAQADDWNALRTRWRERDDAAVLRTIKETLADPAADAEKAFAAFSGSDALPTGSDSERTSYKQVVESNRGKLVPRSRTLRDELTRLCDQGIALLTSSELVAVMSREAVERSLRS